MWWRIEIWDAIYFHELPEDSITAGGIDRPLMPPRGNSRTLKIVSGPHGSPNLFTEASFNELLGASWKVHYNSNRVGVRLTRPKPRWARETGGEAGLHRSNIHDSPYSIGSVSFTGDEAAILTCYGPSLGGFVVFAVVVAANMRKDGQMRQGGDAHLLPITFNEAIKLDETMGEAIRHLRPLNDCDPETTVTDPIVGQFKTDGTKLVCRQAGDRAVLPEFGDDVFSTDSSISYTMSWICIQNP